LGNHRSFANYEKVLLLTTTPLAELMKMACNVEVLKHITVYQNILKTSPPPSSLDLGQSLAPPLSRRASIQHS